MVTVLIAEDEKMIRKGLNMSADEKIIPFSSMTKQGKEEIWSVFDELVGYKKEK